MLTLGLGTLVITLQDPIIKSLMGGYPVMEAVAVRSIVALPIFLVLLRRMGGWRTAFDGATRQAVIRALRPAGVISEFGQRKMAFSVLSDYYKAKAEKAAK